MAEKPFLDASSAASLDLGLSALCFHYHYLLILLGRSSSQMKAQCIDSSKKMLLLLDGMVSDSEEVYNGIIWHLICCPFTPFLTLFGEILSNGEGDSQGNRELVGILEQLPLFLGKMSLRNSLAAKLARVAEALVHHARSVVCPQDASENPLVSGVLGAALPDSWPATWPSTGDNLNWESFFERAPYVSGQPQIEDYDTQQNDLATWTHDFFGDGFVDWIGWESQVGDTVHCSQ